MTSRPRRIAPFSLILLALIGLVLLAAGVATWFLMPPYQFTARTQLHVAAIPPNILFPDDNRDRHEDFVRSQVYLIKHRFVLTAALRSPQVADLSMVQEQTDPVQWLETELKVETPSSEFIHISLSGDRPDDLQKLVSAVTQSYLDNVVDKEANLRNKKLADLKRIFDKFNQRAQEKRRMIRRLQKENGALGGHNIPILQQLAIQDLQGVMKDLGEVRHELRQLHVELGLRPDWVEMRWPRYAAALNCLPGPALPVNQAFVALLHDESLVFIANHGNHAPMDAQELDELISNDKVVIEGQRQIQNLQNRLEHMRENNLREIFEQKSEPLRKQITALTTEVEARRHEIRPILFEIFRAKLTEQAIANRRQIWERYTTLKEMEKALLSDAIRLEQETKQIRRDAVDLDELKEQMEKDAKVMRRAAEKIEVMEVEQEAPSRITLLNRDGTNGKPLAMLYKSNESIRKMMTRVATVLGGLGLGMILLAFTLSRFSAHKAHDHEEHPPTPSSPE